MERGRMGKPAITPTELDAELALLITYWKELQNNKFYGVITVTLAGGEIKHLREDKTRTAASIASEMWDRLPESIKEPLKKMYAGENSFKVEV